MMDIDRDAALVNDYVKCRRPSGEIRIPEVSAALDRLVTAARAKEAAEARVEALTEAAVRFHDEHCLRGALDPCDLAAALAEKVGGKGGDGG